MKPEITLKHKFVEYIPDELQDGVIYISIEFATASHKCVCGCGLEVVTPFTPTDWKLIFDGESVSLDPSIGNWSFPCQSHYWIKRNKIKWSYQWSKEKIQAGRANDYLRKQEHLESKESMVDNILPANPEENKAKEKISIWQKIKGWFK